MHKKEFWILTNKCGNNLKHENEAEKPWLFSLVFVFKIISTFIGNFRIRKSSQCNVMNEYWGWSDISSTLIHETSGSCVFRMPYISDHDVPHKQLHFMKTKIFHHMLMTLIWRQDVCAVLSCSMETKIYMILLGQSTLVIADTHRSIIVTVRLAAGAKRISQLTLGCQISIRNSRV